jgi:N-methylhydantoinase A
MLSNGGFTSAEAASRAPITLLESGPAAGVISAAKAASELGDATRVLAFDMGGTTAKAAVVIDGQPNVTHSFETARVARFMRGSGLPMLVTSIDLIEIGAGGGSIAHIGQLGTLAVGPQSAEGDPGPACYGKGSTHFTVTDADLLLGYIDPAAFLGGRMPLDTSQSAAAAELLGRRLGCDAVGTAVGVREVVDESMAAAARVHIAERGYDPREFVLVATGGAGPVHAVSVARKLGIQRVLCPIAAGAGSCLGLLAAPARSVRSMGRDCELDDYQPTTIADDLAVLTKEVSQELIAAGARAADIEWRLEVDMHFKGQGHSVSVSLPWQAGQDGPPCAALQDAFIAEYQRVFGPALSGTSAIRIGGWRLSGTSRLQDKQPFARKLSSDAAEASTQRRIWNPLTGTFEMAQVVTREAMSPGARLNGPLIVQDAESTLVVPIAARAEVLPSGAILVDLSES